MQSANLLVRVVEPEWLDQLPTHDRLAAGSRSDLRRVNLIMGHGAIIYRSIQGRIPNRMWNLAELGAGDGALALSVVGRLAPELRPKYVTLVDRVPLLQSDILSSFGKLGVEASAVQADAFDWMNSEPSKSSVVFADLFLHHFPNVQLKELLALVAQRCTTFIACEPRRSPFTHFSTRLLRFIGCNQVTRHDAAISVQAGFVRQEISRLWPTSGQWQTEERSAGLFSHLFAANRDFAKV